jgi:hypothetical protein
MKIFVLGGYGTTGFDITMMLAESDLVTHIAIGGRNFEKAEQTAAEIGEKVIAVQVDGTDENALTDLLDGFHIIINAAMLDTVIPSMKAAIKNNAHYCDMAWGEVLDKALHLDYEAKAAGITAIISNGVSPSISNLMGVHAARQLDRVEQLQLGRSDMYNSSEELTPRQWRNSPEDNLVALKDYRNFFTFTLKLIQDNGKRNILDYKDGEWVEVDPFTHGFKVPLNPEGKIKSYPYFSSDPYFGALPDDLSTHLPVEMYFSHLPYKCDNLLREQTVRVIRGDVDSETAINEFMETIENNPHHWLTRQDDYIQIPKMWVRAVGYKENRAVRYNCWFTSPMWNVGGFFLTSVALVAAVLKILRGEIQEHGVILAEKAFEPLPFLDEVAALIPDYLPEREILAESFEWKE